MTLTDRFIYLNLHKTAGSFINEFLLRFLPDARQIGNHLPRRMAPPSHAHLPALGFVRSPWSYYVAWYRFQSRRYQSNVLFNILSDGGRLDFEHTVVNMLELGTTGTRLDAIIAALPATYTNTGLNLPGFALEPIRASGRGFYSYLYRYMYDAPGIMHIRRLDRLAEEWLSMLGAVGQPVTAAMSRHLEEAVRAHRSRELPYEEHYGSALRDLIAERDAEVISNYGFRFGE